MNHKIYYMSGAGNLFTVADNRSSILSRDVASALAPAFCAANSITSKPTEGLLLLENATRSDCAFNVQFFNPDGSNSMMCGNGARCIVRFAHVIGAVENDALATRFTMAGDVYEARLHGDLVTVLFPPPRAFEPSMTVKLEECAVDVSYVDVNSDHVVFEENSIEMSLRKCGREYDFLSVAPAIRTHQEFERGTNVNEFAVQEKMINLRTFERGVEGITGACGTGALATALTAWKKGYVSARNIHLRPPSGEDLFVSINIDDQSQVNGLELTGGATLLGEDVVEF